MKILTKTEVRQIDAKVTEESRSLKSLIDEVGQALSHWFLNHIPSDAKILITCGPGNNGNDGLALATHLLSKKIAPSIFLLKKPNQDELRQQLLEPLSEYIVNQPDFNQYDIVVDALFGIGLSRPLEGSALSIAESIKKCDAKKIAIDIPSGVDSDTGQLLSECARFDYTLTLSASKPGLLLSPGRRFVGHLEVIPVKSLDLHLLNSSQQWKTLEFDPNWVQQVSPHSDSHKYDRGKVAIILCSSYPGAALMSALAAQASGAGYTQVHCPAKLLTQCQVQYPFLVFKSYESKEGLIGDLNNDNFDCLVLGPGWDFENFPLQKVIHKNGKYVIDGGLLKPSTLDFLTSKQLENCVLTPHFGELKTLFSGEQSKSKVELTERWVKETKATLVAKGYDTLICQNTKEKRITTWNSPSLATAGSGDVLAGLIAAFLAGGLSPFEAASFAVWTHRQAASTFPECLTPQILIKEINHLLNHRLSGTTPKDFKPER